MEKRCHVVMRNGDVLVDLLDIKRGVVADLRCRFGGDLTEFGPGFAGSNFYIEPALEFVLLTPNGEHLGARITGNHVLLMIAANCRTGIEAGWRGPYRLLRMRPGVIRRTTQSSAIFSQPGITAATFSGV